MRLVLLEALRLFVQVVQVLVFVRVIMSWFRPRVYNRQTQWFFRAEEFVFRLTEPLLAPIRRLLPMGGMGIDFSPLILLLLLGAVYRLVVSLIFSI